MVAYVHLPAGGNFTNGTAFPAVVAFTARDTMVATRWPMSIFLGRWVAPAWGSLRRRFCRAGAAFVVIEMAPPAADENSCVLVPSDQQVVDMYTSVRPWQFFPSGRMI